MKDFPIAAPFDHVYGTPHPNVEAQKAEFLRALEEDGRRG